MRLFLFPYLLVWFLFAWLTPTHVFSAYQSNDEDITIMNMPIPESKILQALNMQTIEMSPYLIYYEANTWQPVIDDLKKNNLHKNFFTYARNTYQFEYVPRPQSKDNRLAVGFLFPLLDNYPQLFGNADVMRFVAGYATGSFFTVRMDRTYLVNQQWNDEQKKNHMHHLLLPMIFHETTHLLHIRRCNDILMSQQSEFPMEMQVAGHAWVLEGLAENIPMSVDKNVRAIKYRQFYSYFIDKNYLPTYQEFINDDNFKDAADYSKKLAMFYSAAAMMMEYIRLTKGTETIKKFIETQCTQPTDFHRNVHIVLQTTEAQLFKSTFDYFIKNRSNFKELLTNTH